MSNFSLLNFPPLIDFVGVLVLVVVVLLLLLLLVKGVKQSQLLV